MAKFSFVCSSLLSLALFLPLERAHAQGGCYRLTTNDPYGPHNGRTRCCNEGTGSRWYGSHYGERYKATGKLFSGKTCEQYGIKRSDPDPEGNDRRSGNLQKCYDLTQSRINRQGKERIYLECCNEANGMRVRSKPRTDDAFSFARDTTEFRPNQSCESFFVESQRGKCYRLTSFDRFGPHNGRTKCCDETGGSRWWGPHYGLKYQNNGRFYKGKTCKQWQGK